MEQGYNINQKKWENRYKEPQNGGTIFVLIIERVEKNILKLLTYIRLNSIQVKDYFGSCNQHPKADIPIALDSGYTSAELYQVYTPSENGFGYSKLSKNIDG